MRLRTEKVRVPHAQQAADDGDVLLQGRLLEVLVHGMGACQKFMKAFEADVQTHAEANGTPDAISTTDPALEAEHVLLVDAELGHLGLVGRQGDEMLGDVGLLLGRFQKPALGGVGVRCRLRGREGLGGDQEKGRLGIGLAQGFGDVGTVDIGDEVQGQASVAIGLQRLGDHDGTSIPIISGI